MAPRAPETTSSRSRTSTRGDLGSPRRPAKAYTIYDRFFCSLAGSDLAEPLLQVVVLSRAGKRSATTRPSETVGNQWETIFDRALKNNPANLPLPNALGARTTTHRTCPSPPCGARAAVPWTRPAASVLRRLRWRGDAARTSRIIDPPFRDGGGFDGQLRRRASARRRAARPGVHVRRGETPSSSRRTTGAARCSSLYDEWGGFFDHVTPPKVARQLARTRTCPWTSARWASGSQPSRSRRTPARAGRVPASESGPRAATGTESDPQADLVPLRAGRT